jgi:zinc protease
MYADKGITDEELAFTKNSIGQSEALQYETQIQKAYFLSQIIDYGLDRNFTQKQTEILNKINKSEVTMLAKQLLPIDKMHIVVVGDKASLKDKLVKLGYEVVELTKDGDAVDGSNYSLPKMPPPAPKIDPKAPKQAREANEVMEK